MPAKSLMDVKHKRRKLKADAKRAGLPPPPVDPKNARFVQNPTGKNGIEKRKRGGRRMMIWEPIEERYVKGYDRPDETTGEMVRYYPSVLELSQELGLNYDTVSNRCSTDGWGEKRRQWQERVRKAKDEADLQALREAELRIRRKSLKGAEAILDRVAGTETLASMVEAAADPKELVNLAGALRKGQEVANVAIGIPKDGVRSPNADDPGKDGNGAPLTAWARMRGSRQQILVGVSIQSD